MQYRKIKKMNGIEITEEQLIDALKTIPAVFVAGKTFGLFANSLVDMSDINLIKTKAEKSSPEGDLMIELELFFRTGGTEKYEINLPL